MAAPKSKPLVIAVRGEIGAGKSTLLANLKQDLTAYGFRKVLVVPEPSDVWVATGALQDFYKSPEHRALEFQMFVFVTRIRAGRKAYLENPDADVIVLERTPDDDRYIFMEKLHRDGLVDDARMKRYIMTWEGWMEQWPFVVTHTLYVCPTIEACMSRVHERARDGETTVSAEYQQGLRDCHIEYLSRCPTPVLTLRTDIDWRVNPHREAVSKQVAEFLRPSP